MKRVFGSVCALTTCLWAAGGQSIWCKPPDTSTAPRTEFKVLSPMASEFNQPEQATAAPAFVPEAVQPRGSAGVGSLDRAVAPLWTKLTEPTVWSNNAFLKFAAGCGSAFEGQRHLLVRDEAERKAASMERQAPDRRQFAYSVYRMATEHERAGDVASARSWYFGTIRLDPAGDSARMAAKRLERLSSASRVFSEAGEEQSEEPPIAVVERLEVMPTVVRP